MAEGFGQYIIKGSTPRVRELKKRIAREGLSDPEDLMLVIIEIMNQEILYPEVGKFYTFIYNAKTPDIDYDQHPLIACTSIYNWGFKGTNFHWRETRSYTWEEIAGKLHVIEYNELDEMLSIPYMKIRRRK
jgi:hypothetical protein